MTEFYLHAHDYYYNYIPWKDAQIQTLQEVIVADMLSRLGVTDVFSANCVAEVV